MGGKGLGRFTWLKAFSRVEIRSVFVDPKDGALLREFVFDEGYDPDRGNAVAASEGVPGTTVRLVGFKEPYRSECAKSIEQIAQKMVEHFLLVFLQPNCPAIEIHDLGTRLSLNDVFQRDFKAQASAHPFDIRGTPFTLHGFRLTTPRSSRHRLTYAANDRAVTSENLADYMPNLSERLSDGEGEQSFVYLAIVQSPYLNQKVNHARTGFDIGGPDDVDEQTSLFADEVKSSEIREACLSFVQEDLADVMQAIDASKEERLLRYVEEEAPHYRVLLKRRHEFIGKISPSATKSELEGALHHELHQREVALKREGSRILTEGAKLESYDDYHSRLTTFMQEYNELGVSTLAQHVMHRKIVIDLLERAISLDGATGKYPLEKVVHDIIFPMRSSSDDILYSQQNLWLIDERLNYHTFIASDLPLTGLDAVESDSKKRPDLFLFDRKLALAEGEHPISAITLVEFKRPQRDDYAGEANPLDQVLDAVDDIRAGRFKDGTGRPISISNDRIPAHCIIVCDITPSLRKIMLNRDATPTPDGQGFYGYHRNGHAYFEVIDYNKLLRDAKRRNRVLFQKLNLISV